MATVIPSTNRASRLGVVDLFLRKHAFSLSLISSHFFL
jgi:hypothetical protein